MPDRTVPGPVTENTGIREAVCIHTKKIYDSCKDKDCIEDLRLYPSVNSMTAIDHALSVKAGSAELLGAYIDVEPVTFNRGFYTIDIRYFYKVTASAFVGATHPVEVCGLCVFDKRAILFGSESTAKVFTSEPHRRGLDGDDMRRANLPTCVVEAVDPIILNMKLMDVCDCRPGDGELNEVPDSIRGAFNSELAFGGDSKRLYVTLGQFSIIRLERDSQLLVPVYDYCLPEKECPCGNDDDPCEIFRNVKFPVDEFFPPNTLASGTDNYRDIRSSSAT